MNLAVLVKNPFTSQAHVDWDELASATKILVRFLDNVLDNSQFPTEEQAEEARNKRRTGIGFTGLANALQQLRVKYGSTAAIELTRQITKTMTIAAYEASVELAKERGPFPFFEKEKYIQGEFIKKLPPDLQEEIYEHGIRNSVLMTIAPTGTTSITSGNVSSGIEPVFALSYRRKVLQADNSFAEYEVYDYGLDQYRHTEDYDPGAELPDWITHTADKLTVDEHLMMQAAAQEWIDASISKTINCPTEMTFEEFKDVYTKAYKLGLKGCTTYRPDPKSDRGSVLSTEEKPKLQALDKVPMQEIAEGRRYRVKWHAAEASFYVMITDYVDESGTRRPFELFISSKSAQHEEWMKGVSLLITAIFRRGGDVSFVVDELRQVFSANGGQWIGQTYVNSLLAAVGLKIEEHLRWLGLLPAEENKDQLPLMQGRVDIKGETCKRCGAPAVIKKEGCLTCINCGDSKCG